MNKKLIIHTSQLHSHQNKSDIYISTVKEEFQMNTETATTKDSLDSSTRVRKRGIHRVKVEIAMFRNAKRILF